MRALACRMNPPAIASPLDAAQGGRRLETPLMHPGRVTLGVLKIMLLTAAPVARAARRFSAFRRGLELELERRDLEGESGHIQTDVRGPSGAELMGPDVILLSLG